MSALDTQIGGDHYKHLAIQPMEYSMKNGLDACQHTAIKYITRFREKGGIADLEKAKHCIDMLIEFEQQKQPMEWPVGTLDHGVVLQDFKDSIAELKAPVKPETDPYGPRDAEGWYTWKGDETMRPTGRVEVFLNDRYAHVGSAEHMCWNEHSAIAKWRPAQ